MPSLLSLPLELALEIFTLVSSSSQECYRTLLFLSRTIHSMVKYECLSHVPIRIGSKGLHSFADLVESCPGISLFVVHLWINGSTQHGERIIQRCANIVTLACMSRTLRSILTGSELKHCHLTEVTLFDSTYSPWSELLKLPSGPRLAGQLTHYRVHEAVSREFPAFAFLSLTHFSSSSKLDKNQMESILTTLAPIAGLQKIVVTTFHWKDEIPDVATMEVLTMDERLTIVYLGKDHISEFQAWSERSRGGKCIWTQRTEPRRLS
ncbi:hypothetical protein BDQ17DRAFT_1369890 [Cyathus striatus]|nr:hypothetical protein BDQ17DRAFT_1369890 [Cyathus striatus]